jgi:hypothetical protein
MGDYPRCNAGGELIVNVLVLTHFGIAWTTLSIPYYFYRTQAQYVYDYEALQYNNFIRDQIFYSVAATYACALFGNLTALSEKLATKCSELLFFGPAKPSCRVNFVFKILYSH